MPLEEYRRKRKFQQTPEPSGSEVLPPPGSRFVVQMHHATRMHFDFRLEMAGVLKSWAVPKGPTLDPGEKRLAVLVEDHPVEYLTFEGIIPAGSYGAGTVMVWDIGTFEPGAGADPLAMLAKGDLKFILHGTKLRGEFAIVRLKGRPGSKGNEWLWIKKRDAQADPHFDLARLDRSALSGRTLVEIAADRASALWGQEKMPQAAAQAAGRTLAMAGAALAADPSAIPGARPAAMPARIQPMLAKMAEAPPAGSEWFTEIKWDGIRAVAFLEDGAMRLISRNQRDITKQYPDLGGVPRQVHARRAILDGEIICLDSNRRPSFETLQQRMNLRTPDPRKIAEYPVTYYAFDLLYLDGYDLRQTPLERRKEALRAVLRVPSRPEDRALFSDHHVGEGDLLFRLAQEQGLEGILAKRRSSIYREDRSGDWLKIKTSRTQDCVVCGWTEPRGSRRRFGSLVIGVYRDGKLSFAGTVGSGFDERTLDTIWKEIEKLKPARRPFDKEPETNEVPHFVETRLVAEVKFLEWTNEGRMRAPVFLRLRADREPEECVQEPVGVQASARASDVEPPGLFTTRSGEETVTVDGRRMRIQNLNKVFFPKDGVTKVDVVEYYFKIAPYLLPHMVDKPVVMKRYPNGIEQQFFFQKDAGEAMPSWIRLEPVATGQGDREFTRFVICNDRATLVYLANLGCIDHNLWQSRLGTLDHPDFVLFDLDPGEKAGYDKIVEAALAFRDVFSRIGLEAFPKTSGSRGMHIYVPLEPVYSYEQARSFCEVICRLVGTWNPKLMTHERSLGRRPQDRIYLDYMQIGFGKTVPPVYCLRPHPGATVSTPLRWEEVRPGLDPRAFTIHTIWRRLAEHGDLFEGALTRRQRLEAAVDRLSAASG